MKKKILEALTTKFAGVDAKTLERIADKLAKTTSNEEDVQTAVDGVTIAQLMENYGDARATEASASAVSNYEKKYGIKDGKSIQKQDPDPAAKKSSATEGGDKPWEASIKALEERNKALEEKMATYEGEKVARSRKAKYSELIKDLPEKVKTRMAKDFDRLAFKDEDDFTSYLESSKDEIEGIKTDYASRGGSLTPPRGGGSGTGGVSEALKARFEAKESEKVGSVVQGLQTESK